MGSDIPRALKTLGDGAAAFRVALLKGRGNYLCLRSVAEFFASGYWTMSAEEQAEMPHFIEWLRSTPDGDLDGYDGLPRALVSCSGEDCGGRRCPYYTRCFVYRARRNASEAHLVVVNHSLVLAEATNPGGGLLPAYGRLVLDEAHNLEAVATDHLRREFSVPALARLLNRLVRKGRGRRSPPGGMISAIERQLQKGILSGSDAGERVRRMLADATSLVVKVVDAADALADVAAKLLRPARKAGIVRYRVVEDETGGGPVRQHSLHGLFRSYDAEEWSEERFTAAQTRFEAELAALVNLLHGLRDVLEGLGEDGDTGRCADLAVQVGGLAESFVAFANEANFAMRGDKDTHAYWAERVKAENRPSYVRLVGAPLSVAEPLRKMLYDMKDSVVLCSATLCVGNSFSYMAKRLGCAERFSMLTAESPFDYLRQALVLAPDCLPDPSSDSAAYSESLATLMRSLFSATRGRALALFTSYEMMNAVAGHARDALADVGLRLLVQGEGMSRESMTRELRAAGDGVVLFGAQSFWEGVDVSGEARSCVVLARLPFAQIGDPMVEARAEKIDREGGSSFRDYSLPEAVIRFRQGFGRLIRTKRDRGVVVVADPRLVTKGYGAVFRKSIPASVHTVTDVDGLVRRVREFCDDA